MKISADVLADYIALPGNPRDQRTVLEDLGIEGKRHDADTGMLTHE